MDGKWSSIRKTGVIMLLCAVGGGFVVCRTAPFAAALYAAGCVLCGRYLLLYVCSAAGVALGAFGVMNTPYVELGIIQSTGYEAENLCMKYVLILLGVMIVMKTGDIRGHRCINANTDGIWRFREIFFCGIMTVLAEMAWGGDGLAGGFLRGLAEGIIFVCSFYIFLPGIILIGGVCDGGWRREIKKAGSDANQCIVSLMAICSVLLWIMPTDVLGGINMALMVSLALLLYVVYRSGASYGCGLAAAAGGILSIKMNSIDWIPWMMLTALVMLIGRALSGRKSMAAFFYIVGIFLAVVASSPGNAGISWEDGSVTGLIVWGTNLGIPLVLFMLAPGSVLRKSDDVNAMCIQAAASEIGRMTSSKMEDMANTFRRLDYTFAGSEDPGISLSQVGELVDGFRKQIERIGDAREIMDEKLLGQMRELGMEDLRVTETSDSQGRNRYYVTGRTAGQGMVLSRQIAGILSGYLGKNIRVGLDSPSLFFDDYRMAAYEECAEYRGHYHVRRIRKYGSPVSGDNFSVKEYEDGRLVMMLSDGMGSGSLASCESCMMLDTMEEMLEAGFDPEYSIAFANRCMAKKNQGRTFTTFDMVVIDMYDGSMTSFKQGASLTYVLHPEMSGNSVRIISSTTLPIGVLDETECDVAQVALSAGDAVVMVSDGISDLDTDGVMEQLLENIHIGDSRKLVDEIVGEMLGQEEITPRDDVTVMAAVIGRTEKIGAA